VEILPGWLQPLALLSPAAYSLSACRKLMGIGSGQEQPVGAPLSAVLPELLTLALMGVVMIPVGLWVFGHVERRAKKTGKLKRTG
jgi:ABC-2 type transport system permease protein